MKRMLDMEDFPIGTKVMTPSGRIGTVVKHHMTSKIDCFQRISVQFGKNPRDGVVLQPHLLTILIEPAKPIAPEQMTLDLGEVKNSPSACIDMKIRKKETRNP